MTKESRGKAYVEDDGKLGLGVYILVGQCQVTLGQMFRTVTLKDLRASVIYTTLGQDSDWTQSNSDQGVGHQ